MLEKTPTQNILVYSYRRCPFAIRVRMTLHEKGLAFTAIEEDLKNFSEDIKKHHPEIKVPVLIHQDHVIYESAIITEYINEAFPRPNLMPNNAAEKMEVRLWTYWCNNIFKPDIDIFKYGHNKLPSSEIDAAQKRLSTHLHKINNALKTNKYLVGNSYSLADIHLFPFCRQLARINTPHPDQKEMLHLNSWLDQILNRPAFEKTMEKSPK